MYLKSSWQNQGVEKSVKKALLFAGIILLFASLTWTLSGCGGVGGADRGNLFGGGSGSGGVTPTPTPPAVGVSTITVNHVLSPQKVVPSEVTSVSLTGKDVNGTILFGPSEQPLHQQNIFLNVPINVTSVTLNYYADGVLSYTQVVAVTLVAGGNYIINDPNPDAVPPAATFLRFVKNPPTGGRPGTGLVPVQVKVFDQFGNIFTTATDPITLSLSTNPTGATLTGTLTQSPVNGIATFSDLSINLEGTGYTLLATAPNLPDRMSGLFNVITADSGNPTGSQFLTEWFVGLAGDMTMYPGYCRIWDLDTDFNLVDGGDDTYDGAMLLSIGGTSFPSDQTYAEQTWLTPLTSTLEGLLGPVVADNSYVTPIAGTYSAYLPPAASTILSQTVDLTGSAAPITLNWTDRITSPGSWPYIDGGNFQYQVTIRDLSGNLLATAFQTNVPIGQTGRTFDLSAFAGQQVQICFESIFFARYGYSRPQFAAEIDDVSVVDGSATQRVANGDFELGNLTGWTGTVNPQSQNMRSGMRTVNGLDVTRTVYSRPDHPWIRYYDEFTNNTAAPITATIDYYSDLGSDDSGTNSLVPGSNGEAMSSFDDSTTGDSDLGFVWGTGATLIGFTTFSENVEWTYQITVNPGETVAFCTFALQNGLHSYPGPATGIETECLNILNNFRTSAIYQDGLSNAQMGRILNL